MTERTSWCWGALPKPLRRAHVTVPLAVWDTLEREFADKVRRFVTVYRSSSTDGQSFDSIVATLPEAFLHDFLLCCNIVEAKLGIAEPEPSALEF